MIHWLYATEAMNFSNDAKSCRKHFITLYLLFQNFSGFCTVAGVWPYFNRHATTRICTDLPLPRKIEGHDRGTC